MTRHDPYDILTDVLTSIQRVEDKLDAKLQVLDGRINILEAWKNNLMGRITMIGALAGAVMGIVFSLITALIERRI